MPYRDPDSGLEFSSYDEYREAREPRQEPSVEELCAADGHAYDGDDCGVGRCYCGLQQYPKGGPPRGCAACEGDPDAHGMHVCGRPFGG